MENDELLLKEEVYRLIGAAMEVYNEFGCGYTEPPYQEAYEMELGDRAIPFSPIPNLPIFYKGRQLKKTFIPDLIAFESVIVELKALDRLTPKETSQVLNYLRSACC